MKALRRIALLFIWPPCLASAAQAPTIIGPLLIATLTLSLGIFVAFSSLSAPIGEPYLTVWDLYASVARGVVFLVGAALVPYLALALICAAVAGQAGSLGPRHRAYVCAGLLGICPFLLPFSVWALVAPLPIVRGGGVLLTAPAWLHLPIIDILASPYWLVLMAIAFLVNVALAVSHLRELPLLDSETPCLNCGYERNGLSEDAPCPECGAKPEVSA